LRPGQETGWEQSALRGAGRDLRRARGGREAPPEARLPCDRDLGAVDRGDGGQDHRARRAPPCSRDRVRFMNPAAEAAGAKPVPRWRWGVWWGLLLVPAPLFSLLLAP